MVIYEKKDFIGLQRTSVLRENSLYFRQRFESDTFTLLFRATIDSVIKYIKNFLLREGDNKCFTTM